MAASWNLPICLRQTRERIFKSGSRQSARPEASEDMERDSEESEHFIGANLFTARVDSIRSSAS